MKAITWFNINKETDWRINSTGGALSGYQAAVSDPYYLAEIVATGVEEQAQTTPVNFQVEPAYPNPFNGEVMIRYTAPQGMLVHVQIVDLLGKEISSATVFGKGSAAQFQWDGTNARGRAVASGLYFAVFRTSMHLYTQKLLYTK